MERDTCLPAYRRASLPLIRAWTSSGLKQKQDASNTAGQKWLSFNNRFKTWYSMKNMKCEMSCAACVLQTLTSWAWFCRAACIWGLWWLGGCQWSRSPQRPRRSRSTLSSSLSPPLREWSLWTHTQRSVRLTETDFLHRPLCSVWSCFVPDCMSKAACSLGGQ